MSPADGGSGCVGLWECLQNWCYARPQDCGPSRSDPMLIEQRGSRPNRGKNRIEIWVKSLEHLLRRQAGLPARPSALAARPISRGSGSELASICFRGRQLYDGRPRRVVDRRLEEPPAIFHQHVAPTGSTAAPSIEVPRFDDRRQFDVTVEPVAVVLCPLSASAFVFPKVRWELVLVERQPCALLRADHYSSPPS